MSIITLLIRVKVLCLTFHNLLVLLVGLGGLLGELLVSEDAEVPDGAPSLALRDHLLENLCERIVFIERSNFLQREHVSLSSAGSQTYLRSRDEMTYMILQGINTSLTWGQGGDRSCVIMVMVHSLLAISAAILYLVTTRSSEMVGRSSLIESSAVILELILLVWSTRLT